MNVTETHTPTLSTPYFQISSSVYRLMFLPVRYLLTDSLRVALLSSGRHPATLSTVLWMGFTDASVAESGAWGETPANPPEHNNARQCSMAPSPMSPTVLLLLTPHILWGLRRSVGCHGSLGALEMNLHSRVSQWLINTDRERKRDR